MFDTIISVLKRRAKTRESIRISKIPLFAQIHLRENVFQDEEEDGEKEGNIKTVTCCLPKIEEDKSCLHKRHQNRRVGLCEEQMQKDISEVRLKVMLRSMETMVW